MRRIYEDNALDELKVGDAFLPLLDRAALKRLCFGSSAVPTLAHFLGARDDEDDLALFEWQGDHWPW